MGKRVRISNDRLNSYGFRVLTEGMDVEQFRRNPVLLYMHERGNVIGVIEDLKVEGGDVTGELKFDEATELSLRCKKQWEFGSLKMVSVGLAIIETSEEPEFLVEGQTRPTVTKSKLLEVSLVDIGANDDAIRLQKDGKWIELKDGGTQELPLINKISINNQNEKEMDLKKLALELGLQETATESEVTAKLAELKSQCSEVVALRAECDTLKTARIESLVNGAIDAKKIGADKKQQFVELGKKIGAEELEKTFGAMQASVKLSQMIGGGTAGHGGEYTKLSDVPESEVMKMRENNVELYKKLYKAEYGFECEL